MCCQLHGGLGLIGVMLNDCKLIPADARDDVLFRNNGVDAVGNRLEQRIAKGVATSVVDGLELIEIEANDAKMLILASQNREARVPILHGNVDRFARLVKESYRARKAISASAFLWAVMSEPTPRKPWNCPSSS